MMTKTVSKTKVLLFKIALLPLFSGLIYFVCVESIAQEKSVSSSKNTTQVVQEKSISPSKSTTQSDTSKDKQRDSYYAGVHIIVNDCNKKTLIDKKYEELTSEEKKRFLNYVPSPKLKKTPTETEFKSWKNEKDFAIWLDEKNIPNSELNQYSTKDIVYFAGSFVHKNARTKRFPQLHQFHLYTQSYFDKNLKDSHLKFSGKELRMTLMENKKDKAKSVQTKTTNLEEDKIYNLSEVTEKPEFPGGIEKFYHFVGENYKAPSEPNLKGKVYITFIVEKDGSLNDVKIIRDPGYGTGDEAIRVLKLSPKWSPGKIANTPVRVLYSLPISIQSSK